MIGPGQQSQMPATTRCDVTAGDNESDITAAATDAEDGVTVTEEDFYAALSRLTPSLSASELKRYDSLQDMFTPRHHGDHHQQQQQSLAQH